MSFRGRFLLPALCVLQVPYVSPCVAAVEITQERIVFPAHIEGVTYNLEAMVYRPAAPGRYPLALFSHGRNGPRPSRDPNTVNYYGEICRALAETGRVAVYFVRRGYGASEGVDTELQSTAVASGLEAAKDYRGALDYWRTRDFVRPDRVVLMGQSQGGWASIACTAIAMPGVLGTVNISGGTNYALMGSGRVTPEVQDHWVTACAELGRDALVPSFWVYSENDQSISSPTARRMYEAFRGAGADVSLLMLPPFGNNGHGIVGVPSLFMPDLEAFFQRIGLDRPEQVPVRASEGDCRIANLSARGVISSGENALIVGFVVSGTNSKTLLIQGCGLSFARNAGLDGEVARPYLALFHHVDGVPHQVAANDDWQQNREKVETLGRQLGASPLTSSSDPARGDAALVLRLEPGMYSVVATPSSVSANREGIGLVELYDAAPFDDTARLSNLSARGLLGSGSRQMIVGLVTHGSGSRRVMIRSVGPTLAQLGVTNPVQNPSLRLYRHVDASPIPVGSNAEWSDSAQCEQVFALTAALGAFALPRGSADAVVLQRLEPGMYTAISTAEAAVERVVLTEIYDTR